MTKFGFGCLLALAALLPLGCAAPSAVEPLAAGQAGPQPQPQAEAQRAEPPALKPEDYPVRAFEGDSLFNLLAAEVAGFRGDLEFAMEKYGQTAKATRDPNVTARAARLAIHLKKAQLALELLDLWLVAEPHSAEARRQTLNFLTRINPPGAAAYFPAIAALLDRRLDDPALAFVQATVLERMGRRQQALAILDSLLATSADLNAALMKAGLLASLSRQDESLAFVRARLAEHRDHPGLRLMLARLLYEREELSAARRQFQILLRKSPHDGETLLTLGLIALRLEDDAAAQQHFRRMALWNHRAGEAHYYLGGIAERQGRPALALKAYALAGDGYEFVPSQARIAALLAEQGRLPEARQRLQLARLSHPQHARQLLLAEAQLLEDQGAKQAALAFLDGLMDQAPEDLELLFYRAMASLRLDRLDLMERDLRTIIARQPDHADALNALGYTLTDQTDRHQEALALIQKALAIRPDEPAFIDSLGWAQYRLKNYDEALRHLRRALELYPNDEIAAHLGEVLWVTGQHQEAEAIWEEALEQTPDSEILKRTIHRLRESG